MIDALGLRVGTVVDHPRLGPCEVLSGEEHLTVRTEKGDLIEGVHPVSFAGPALLDRFGLTPETDSSVEEAPPPDEPATEPEPDPAENGVDAEENVRKPVVKESLTAQKEPDAEPATGTAEGGTSRNDTDPDEDPRALVRDLVERSGRSQASLSRALGKDPSFLNGILKRGRGVPEDLVDRLTRLLNGTESAERTPAPETEAPHVAEPEDLSGETVEDTSQEEPAPAGAGVPETRERDRVILLRPSSPVPEAEMLEVVIDGVCRVRVPAGYDMEAAARLIRSVSAGIPAMSRGS